LAKILKEDSEWIKTQYEYKNSKVSKTSKNSKKVKKNQNGGTITEKYSFGYIPNRDIVSYNNRNNKTEQTDKNNSKISLSKKNKLFYYKDN
jgi:hypothetical protein